MRVFTAVLTRNVDYTNLSGALITVEEGTLVHVTEISDAETTADGCTVEVATVFFATVDDVSFDVIPEDIEITHAC